MTSPFLGIPDSTWVAANGLAFAVRDAFPVSPGHSLVVPRRLVATWFEATREEQVAILDLIDDVKRQLDAEFRPDGYNVGFNAGQAAGQTIFHLHVHVIPRYTGDVPDPRGGVRHVIPAKGNHLRAAPLTTGGAEDPFLAHLLPLFGRAYNVAIVAAFVQESGLDVLRPSVVDSLRRGAKVRLITGDYLQITQVDALETLLAWSSLGKPEDDPEAEGPGRLEARVVEVDKLEGASTFHPKSWRFEGPGFGVAFVGSSNVSRLALGRGVEWNLRAERERDREAYERISGAFDHLWTLATPLTSAWIDTYRERARRAALPAPVGEVDVTPLAPPPEPNDVQREALTALARSRAEGHRRALVVLATGLGKTWLAAFDVEAFGRDLGRCPRVLFLAHRAELLTQAGRTFRRMLRRSFPEARTSWCVGAEGSLEGEVVLGSVQKLGRAEQLQRLAPDAFDYVIVDEVHHADAPTYRRILARLEPRFLLGLTATPERADDGDVLGLFDDHQPYEAGIGEGIGRGLLSPFAYFGLKDDVDYAVIPWRNRRFDPAVLAQAVQTQRRMERLWEAWQAHPGTRTLVFCASIEHAAFARDWLRERGVRVEAVHSGEGSADRTRALPDLEAGRLDALCAVDLFNEGIDVPLVDRVVMLRPTESIVVFLQQLGRGLRRAVGKSTLTVIDFVGNHRVFLGRVRMLLSLGRSAPTVPLRAFLEGREEPELPAGCSVEVDLEAKEVLQQLLGPSGASAVEQAYVELRAARGTRPTIVDLYHQGYRPSTLRKQHEGWFRFVAAQGDLTDDERRVLEQAGDWLDELEHTSMSKCFKMVLLEALLEADAVTTGLALDELAQRSLRILQRSPELGRDLDGVRELEQRPIEAKVWRAYWRKNPVAAWTGEGRKGGGRAWFRLEGQPERLTPRFSVAPEDLDTLATMTRELVDYRLAQYRNRRQEEALGEAFECKVLSNQRDPILKLPSRSRRPELPSGEVAVRVAPDGRVWQFRFMKEFVNVARPAGEAQNALPDLLRGWFGPAAGKPGTAFMVRFAPTPDGWWAEPAGGEVLQLPPRGLVRAFPTLQAAAGAAKNPQADAPEAEFVRLPVQTAADDVFAVRAAGDSMDGGRQPIRDGDWLLFRFSRGAGLKALVGRVALLQVDDPRDGHAYQVKRLVEEAGRIVLRSDNPARPSFPATTATTPVATLVEVIAPERLAPAPGTVLEEDRLASAFGLTEPPRTGRVDGLLFLLVDAPGTFVAPDRVRWRAPARRPAETVYVLARAPGEEHRWRYVGVGRWLEDEGLWATPDLDHGTWTALGEGRECSRRLPDSAVERADQVAARLLDRLKPGEWAERAGKRCRVLERTRSGSVRIDGGPDGFKARNVSLTDLAWVLLAHDDVLRHGGVLDEARVNRLRYLEGTPKAATRWIDTGWAIVLAHAAGALESR